MAERITPTRESVLSFLSYDQENGKLYWKPRSPKTQPDRTWNTRWAGREAGHINDQGYRIICLNYIKYRAHQLIWLIHYREWPTSELDHINRNPEDNRIINLRIATRSENNANTGVRRNSKSGLKGAYPEGKRWRASLTKDGRGIHLGRFETPEEAHRAYCEAAQRLHGEFARSR